MGNKLSFIQKLFKRNSVRILMLGLDNSGKTTILYALKLDELITTIPTIGFNVERVKYNNITFTVWDIGGQDKIRHLWKHYYINTDAIIFVIDSSDLVEKDRINNVKEELHNVMNDINQMYENNRYIQLLIYANKQDLPNSVSTNQLIKYLSLKELKNKWYVQPTCAINKTGLYEGLEWLSNELKN